MYNGEEEQQQHVINVDLADSKENRGHDLQHSIDDDELTNRMEKEPKEGLKRSTLLAIFTLNTTLSFQLGVTPPGGFYQDGHKAGAPLMKDKQPARFLWFKASCRLSFYTSLLLIFVLLTGFPIKSRVFKMMLVFNFSSLVFLYQIAQTDNDHVILAFITSFLSFSCGTFYIFLKHYMA